MEFLLSRYRNLTVLLVVVLAQLVLLAYQVKSNQDVRLIRVWAVTAVTPLAHVLEIVRANTIGVAQNYFVLVNVREENQRLKDEAGKLKMENQFLRNELSTADRAIALQAFQARTPSRTIPSRIIGTGTGANSRVVFVDRGSAAGVMRGMAVVTPDGIVGKVLAAYPTASQVLLITDASFAAGVISQKNRVHGTLKGLGQSKVLINYVQNEEKVEVGEMFYTSGDDRIFPKGMPVGKVSSARPGRQWQEIYVVPTSFQQGLEEVLIVVEGVHQSIPDLQQTAPSQEVSILPPPPHAAPEATTAAGVGAGAAGAAAAGTRPAGATTLQTEADKLRDRYKRIGDAQGHTFGEGLPGSKPPNFNLNPDAPKPPAASPQAATPAVKPPASPATPQTGVPQSGASGAKPPSPRPEAGPGSAQPATAQPGTAAPKPAIPKPLSPNPQSGTSTTPGTGAPARTVPAAKPQSASPAVQPGTSAPKPRPSEPTPAP